MEKKRRVGAQRKSNARAYLTASPSPHRQPLAAPTRGVRELGPLRHLGNATRWAADWRKNTRETVSVRRCGVAENASTVLVGLNIVAII
jgi:hypothetical protein